MLEFNCNPLGCFRAGWPRVITVHDLYFEVMPSFYPWRHRLWWRLLFPLSLRSASVVICVSRNTRRELEIRHPDSRNKLVVVYEAGVVNGDAPVRPSIDRLIRGALWALCRQCLTQQESNCAN